MTVTSQFTLLTKFTTLELSGEEIKLVLWGSKATQFDIPEDNFRRQTNHNIIHWMACQILPWYVHSKSF